MPGADNLNISVVKSSFAEGSYTFDIAPVKSGWTRLLCKDARHKTVLATAQNAEKLTICAETLEALDQAYVFLQDGANYSAAVQVFTRRPIPRRVLLGDEIVLFFEESAALRYPGQFYLRAYSGDNFLGWANVEKPLCAVRLAALGIEPGMPSARVEIQYASRDGDSGAQVYSAPYDLALRLEGVSIALLENGENNLRITEKAGAPGFRAVAQILRDGQPLAEIDCGEPVLDMYSLDISKMNLTGGGIWVRMAYKNDLLRSRWGEAVPVVTETPELTSHAFPNNAVALTFARKAYYDCGGSRAYGDTLSFPFGQESAGPRIAVESGGSVSLGPKAEFPLRFPAFYTSGNRIYFGARPGEDILAERSYPLHLQYETWEGECFSLSGGTACTLTLLAGSAEKDIAADFCALLSAVCTGEQAQSKATELRAAAALAPLTQEQTLAIRHGFRPDAGLMDLQPGMLLMCETSLYQNIPELRGRTEEPPSPQSDRNQSGFVGAGWSEYSVVARSGKVTLEPFLTALIDSGALAIPAPDPVPDTSRQTGGAGVLDMLFPEMRAPFLRIVYPKEIPDRYASNYGSMFYFDHVCLLSGSNYADLESASEQLRGGRAPCADSAAITYPRGRAAMLAGISVLVGGVAVTCSLGATLGDLIARCGGSRAVSVARVAGSRAVPLENPDDGLLLCMGDRIELA